jgi:hypothetical protein
MSFAEEVRASHAQQKRNYELLLERRRLEKLERERTAVPDFVEQVKKQIREMVSCDKYCSLPHILTDYVTDLTRTQRLEAIAILESAENGLKVKETINGYNQAYWIVSW